MTRFRTLLFLLLFPLPALALVGPPVAIGVTDPLPGNGIDHAPSIATNGDQFFVVWDERRADQNVIRGSRLAGDGTVLDPDGILITTDGDTPGVAWNGYAWAITWFTGNIGYMGRLYGTDGQPLAPPIGISWSYEHNSTLAVGNERIATFLHGNHVLIMNRELNGMKELKPEPGSSYAAIASNGNDFLRVSGLNQGGIVFTHLDRDGNVVSTSTLAGQSAGPIQAVWSGDHYWVVWLPPFPPGTAYAVSVSADGTPGTPLAIGMSSDFGMRLNGLPDGGAIAYLNATGTIAVELSASAVVASTPIAMSRPVLATNARGETIGVWIDGAVRSAQFRPDGTPADNGQPLVRTPASSSMPVTDPAGGSPLVAFLVEHGSARDVVVRNPAGGPPQVLTTSSNTILGPAHGGNGTSTLTAWTTCSTPSTCCSVPTSCTIDAAFLAPNNGPQTLRLAQMTMANRPTIAWTGSLYVVLWSEGPTLTAAPELHMVRVSSSGKVLDASPIHVATGAFGNNLATSVVRGDDATLVVWNEVLVYCNCSHGGRPHRVRALRLDESGNPIDSEPFTIASFTDQDFGSVSAAWDGTAFTIVWNNNRVIDGVRMLPSGSFTPFLTSTIHTVGPPVIAANGRELMMAWLDSPNRVLAGTIDGNGAVVNAGGFEARLYVPMIGLAHLGGDGVVLMTTEVMPDEVTIGVMRTVTPGAPAAHRRP